MTHYLSCDFYIWCLHFHTRFIFHDSLMFICDLFASVSFDVNFFMINLFSHMIFLAIHLCSFFTFGLIFQIAIFFHMSQGHILLLKYIFTSDHRWMWDVWFFHSDEHYVYILGYLRERVGHFVEPCVLHFSCRKRT